MPDLDTDLAALGERLRASITPPDLASVADRARERSVRRRTQLAAIVVVLVVSAAVPLLRSIPGGDAPASEQSPRTRPPTYSVEFADADHGFAVDRQCERSDSCRLLATSDGGETWTGRELPPAESGAAIVGLLALGPERVAIDRVAPGSDNGGERIYSDDAGRTWTTVEKELHPNPIEAIPEGGVLGEGCAGQPGGMSCGQMVVTVPDTGKTRVLANQPDFFGMAPSPVPTAGGTWWVAGTDSETETTVLSVSTDSGRTWRTSTVDVPYGRPSNTVAVVEGGGVLYAAVAGTIDRSFDLLGIFRSDDDGVTWTRTYRPVEGQRVPGFVGTPIVTPAGLLLSTSGGTFDGEAVTPSEDELSGFVRWTRAGYVSDLPSSDNEFAVSADGTDWRRFTVG